MPSNCPSLSTNRLVFFGFWPCLALVVLMTACAPNTHRDRLSSTQSYSALYQELEKEHNATRAARDQEHARLESPAPPEPPKMEPLLPSYNPLEETRVSISVRSEPLHDVLFVVVRNAGLDLVVDPNLSLDNLVTISFENALSSEVVRSLLEAYDVSWSVRDNVLTVRRFEERNFNLEFMNAKSEVTLQGGGDIFGSSDADDANSDMSGTFMVSASMGKGIEEGSMYAAVQRDMETLLAGPDGPMGIFSLNPVSGAMYVQTTPRRMRAIEDMVARLRGKLGKQVIIDARILEVTLNDGFDLGVDWNFVQTRMDGGRGFQYGIGVSPETGLGTRGDSSELSAIVLGDPAITSISNTVDTIFQATINALQTFGGVKIVSNPHVRARHGLPALVTSGTTKNYIKEITRETNTQDNTISISTDTASAFEGVMLGVVPFIRDDNSVDLDIFPITSKVDLSKEAAFVDGSSVTLPVVDVRNVSTNVRAHDGDTVILGGLIYKNAEKTDNAVPGMGNVPGLGWLFNSRNDGESTRELVIVMHIRVVG